MEKHKTLIISTATKCVRTNHLQGSARNTGESELTPHAMAKGRSRYFCQMRCDVHMESEMNAYGYIRDDVDRYQQGLLVVTGQGRA